MFDTTHTVKHRVLSYRLAESLVRNTTSVCLELNYRLLKPKFTIRTTSCNNREPQREQLLRVAKEISQEQQVLDFVVSFERTNCARGGELSLSPTDNPLGYSLLYSLQVLLYDQVLWRLCVLGKLNHIVWDTLFNTVVQRTIKEFQ